MKPEEIKRKVKEYCKILAKDEKALKEIAKEYLEIDKLIKEGKVVKLKKPKLDDFMVVEQIKGNYLYGYLIPSGWGYYVHKKYAEVIKK